MDNGLRRVRGQRLPTAVADVDLPDLARAITSVMRGQAAAQTFRSDDRGYIRFLGRGIDVSIVAADWRRILEHIVEESLTTDMFPVSPGVRPTDARVDLSSSTVDARDPLYKRVYGLLAQLFTLQVPT